jgi:hypothetical protein
MNKSPEKLTLSENTEGTAKPSQDGNRDFDRAMESVGSFTHGFPVPSVAESRFKTN